jgi:hypothetical protein
MRLSFLALLAVSLGVRGDDTGIVTPVPTPTPTMTVTDMFDPPTTSTVLGAAATNVPTSDGDTSDSALLEPTFEGDATLEPAFAPNFDGQATTNAPSLAPIVNGVATNAPSPTPSVNSSTTELTTPAPTVNDNFTDPPTLGDETVSQPPSMPPFRPSSPRTPFPTSESSYVPNDDDPLQPVDPTEFTDDVAWKWKDSELEDIEHDRTVLIALLSVLGVGILLSICVAQQTMENPNGCCARYVNSDCTLISCDP